MEDSRISDYGIKELSEHKMACQADNVGRFYFPR